MSDTTITVGKLKQVLSKALNTLGDYNSEETIQLRCNTYGLYGDFIAIGSKGYLGLSEIEDRILITEDEDEYEE